MLAVVGGNQGLVSAAKHDAAEIVATISIVSTGRSPKMMMRTLHTSPSLSHQILAEWLSASKNALFKQSSVPVTDSSLLHKILDNNLGVIFSQNKLMALK